MIPRKKQIARQRRDTLVKYQGNRCHYCRCHMDDAGSDLPRAATLDHRVPRCLGGKIDMENIVAACRRCNKAKADMSEADFLAILRPGLSRVREKPRHDAEIERDRAARKARERRCLTSSLHGVR